MGDSDIFLKVPSMDENAHLQGISLVDDNQSDILSQALVSTEEVKLSDSPVQWGYVIDTDSKLNLKMQSSPATITLIKIGGIEDLNPLNYTTHIAPPLNQIHRVVIDDEILNEQLPEMIVASSKIKDKSKKKYMPPLPQTEPAVICQNCDASFATKYYYQRHQCEFNASKVMLKSELPKRNIEKPKTKHECDICHKSFMTEHNLDRHRLSHGEKKPFICQNCGKGFVLESRLNTHIENHCKMTSGEKKRFYRSDLSVWECWNCKLITAKEPNDVVHICNSQMPTFIITKNCIQSNDNQENKENDPKITFPYSSATSKPTQESVKIVKILGENNFTTTENFILNNFDANFEKAMSGIDLFSQPEPGFYKEAATPKNIRIINDNNNMKIEHTFVKIRVEQLFQCEYCNRTYAKKDVLKDHQNSHTVNQNYLCMFCEESFESYTNAIVHWQHKCDNKWNVFCLPKIVVCKFCDKGFKSHELLYAHKYKLRHFVPKVCKDGRNETSKQNNKPNETDLNSKRSEGTERGLSEVKKDVIYSTINISFDDNTRIRTLTIDDLTKLSLDMPDNNKSVVDMSNGDINVSEINIQDILMDSNNTSVKADNGCENDEETNQPINDYEYNEIDKFLNEIERKVLDNKGLCDRAADNENNMTNIKTESIEILDMVQDEVNSEEPFKKRLRRSSRKCIQTENVDKENVTEKDENFEKNKRGRKKSSEFFKVPLQDINKRQTRNSLKNLVEKENIDQNIVRNENLEDETIEKKNKSEETELTVNIKLERDDDKSDKTDEDTDSTITTVVAPVPSKRGRKPKPKINIDQPVINECADGFRFQCEKCGSCAQSIDDLISHRSDVHGSKFDCKECGQVVHSSKALMIHCRAHQSLKPFVCDQCGRSYSQTSHLWQHMRFHQGIKPFACPHEGCEARYTIRPDLKDHIRKVHTRERPFRCAVCGKCFLTGSVYYQHRLIHNNDRRYGCDMCGKRFFRADALNNHRRIHTDERPFPCPVCGREFRQKGDRNKHHRTQHPVELAQSLVANTSMMSI